MSETLPSSLFHFRTCREGRERAVKICGGCGTDAALGERGGGEVLLHETCLERNEI